MKKYISTISFIITIFLALLTLIPLGDTESGGLINLVESSFLWMVFLVSFVSKFGIEINSTIVIAVTIVLFFIFYVSIKELLNVIFTDSSNQSESK